MNGFVTVRSAAGTHTGSRERNDTEIPKSRSRLFDADEFVSSVWNERHAQPQVLRLYLGGQECSIPSSSVRERFGSSLRAQGSAVFEGPDADLSARLGRVLRFIAAFPHGEDWGFAEVVERFLTHSAAVPRQRYAGSTSSPTSRRYKRFRGELIAAFLTEPIEDGVTHPAERVIDEALCADSAECQDWLSQVLVETYKTRPSISASIVRCIGRQEYDRVGNWGMRVVDDALQNSDAEVRDAAICALEAWGGSVAIQMLRRHEDTEDWLNAYVQQVIVDLSGTTP